MSAAAFANLEAIKQLKARYLRSIDAQDWEQWRGTVTADATYDVTGFDQLSGRDAIATLLRRSLTGATSIHHCHMPELSLVRADEASAGWAQLSRVGFADDDRPGWENHAYVKERYQRIGVEWRIRGLEIKLLRRAPLTGRYVLPARTDPPERLPNLNIGALTPRVLNAIQAIKRLRAQWCRHLDQKNWTAWSALLADDARFEAINLPHRFPTLDSFAALRAHVANANSVHHGHMPEIWMLNEERAQARWSVEHAISSSAVTGARDASWYRAFGASEEEYIRVDGDWRVASMRATYSWVELSD